VTEHRLRLGDRVVSLIEGPAGWGEWSPLPGYPCDPAAARRAAEEAALLGWPARLREHVVVNALVTDWDFDRVALAAYPAVKVKVRDRRDLDLVAAVRDAVGPRVRLRVDANGAWDLETAVEMIERLSGHDLELVEQPVASLDDLARLRRRVGVPVAADECIRSVADARRLHALDAADAVVLKVQPLGGVRAALAVAEAARVPAIPSSMLETSVGLVAGLALAAALPELPYACGLATATGLAIDVTRTPLVPEAGTLRVRPVVPDADLLARYREAAPDQAPEPASDLAPTKSTSSSATSSGRSRCTA
jgi:o-succinylbenzoate synthase